MAGATNGARPDFVVQGEPARLIPIPGAGRNNKETAATSAFLATMIAVDEFAQAITDLIGIHLGAKARVQCYTEVVFKTPKGQPKFRPDGLIHIATGKQDRYFLVEAKVANADLDPAQIEEYVTIAKEFGVEGVITISNQYAPLPTYHPVTLPKSRTKGINLYHWSWTSILTEAQIAAKHTGVADPDQAFILNELIRFLEHPSAGVLVAPSMGSQWSEGTRAAFQGHGLHSASPAVEAMVGSWHQLIRHITLDLSARLGRPVTLYLTRKHRGAPEDRLRHDCQSLQVTKRLVSEIEIPDAASRLLLICDFQRRALEARMTLNAPTDKAQVRAHRTWIKGQLSKSDDPNIGIVAHWPGRAPSTTDTLGRLDTEDSTLIPNGITMMPTKFEIFRLLDLGDKITQTTKFPDYCKSFLWSYYKDIGQHLRPYQAPAPRAKEPPTLREDGLTLGDPGPSIEEVALEIEEHLTPTD
ncbi:MAG: hypothetical protein KY455_04080 [Euryarchaeota archaeon]|nr:hypothetical protein [Euryarchaeota archaeon]